MKKLWIGSIVLIVLIIISFIFYWQYTYLFRKLPKIISQDNEGVIGDRKITGGFTISYKNSTYRASIINFADKEEASRFFDTYLMDIVRTADKNGIPTSSISIKGFNGHRIIAPKSVYDQTEIEDHIGFLLLEDKNIVVCTCYTKIVEDAEYVCDWFIKEKFG